MQYLLIGLAAIVVLLLMGQRLTQVRAATLAPILRVFLVVVLVALGAFLAVRGALPLAIPLFLLALSLLGFGLPLGRMPFGTRSSGGRSSVRTSLLDMELEHDSGAMDGWVLAGEFEGRRLSELSFSELMTLRGECLAAPDQSAAMMEAYLDRQHEGWRDAAGASGEDEAKASSGGGAMTVEEAYSLLGLSPGASARDIRAAHRRLMKQVHPDRGGSDYLAAKINQAKDILLEQSPA